MQGICVGARTEHGRASKEGPAALPMVIEAASQAYLRYIIGMMCLYQSRPETGGNGGVMQISTRTSEVCTV